MRRSAGSEELPGSAGKRRGACGSPRPNCPTGWLHNYVVGRTRGLDSTHATPRQDESPHFATVWALGAHFRAMFRNIHVPHKLEPTMRASACNAPRSRKCRCVASCRLAPEPCVWAQLAGAPEHTGSDTDTPSRPAHADSMRLCHVRSASLQHGLTHTHHCCVMACS